MTVTKIAVASMVAASLLASPVAFAQTSDKATSTGAAEIEKDRTDANTTRNQQVTPTDSTMPSARKPMEDGTTGTTATTMPKGGKPVQGTDTSQ